MLALCSKLSQHNMSNPIRSHENGRNTKKKNRATDNCARNSIIIIIIIIIIINLTLSRLRIPLPFISLLPKSSILCSCSWMGWDGMGWDGLNP